MRFDHYVTETDLQRTLLHKQGLLDQIEAQHNRMKALDRDKMLITLEIKDLKGKNMGRQDALESSKKILQRAQDENSEAEKSMVR